MLISEQVIIRRSVFCWSRTQNHSAKALAYSFGTPSRRLYGKHLRMLWNYHPGGITGLPNLSTNVAHILKSRRGIPSGFFQNSGHFLSQLKHT
nr:MAG TPA: hypothetical protein [Caudoviricetes sp.]